MVVEIHSYILLIVAARSREDCLVNNSYIVSGDSSSIFLDPKVNYDEFYDGFT
jgi:hypothetical protein